MQDLSPRCEIRKTSRRLCAQSAGFIGNEFDAPVAYPALSVDWDWRKYDLGVRIGLLRDVDLTLEYSRHDMIVPTVGTLHPDEALATLRVGVRP